MPEQFHSFETWQGAVDALAAKIVAAL